MIDQTTKSATPRTAAIRDLALAEIETVSGGLSVKEQERLALQHKLTEAYKSHQTVVFDAIENKFHP